MNELQQNILRIRIAANALYKLYGALDIEIKDSDLYDLLVFDKQNNIKFAVKVGSSTVTSTKKFQSYIDLLSSKNFSEVNERYPIVLMTVNESSEEVYMGIVLGWESFIPVVYKDVTLKRIKTNVWDVFLENLKIMDSVIRILSEDKWNIVKRLHIQYSQDLESCAELIYLRKFSENYKMINTGVNSQKEDFNKYFFQLKEEDFPTDIFDEELYNTLTKQYYKVVKDSSLLLLNSDFKNFKRNINQYQYEYTLNYIIEPNRFNELGAASALISCPQYNFVVLSNNRNIKNDILYNIVPVEEWSAVNSKYTLLEASVETNIMDFINLNK